jgi:hypothetical protein
VRLAFRLEQSPELERLLREAPERVRRAGLLAAKRAAEDYVDEIHKTIKSGRSFTPRTGQLEQSINWRPTDGGALVSAGAKYARYVEYDTPPHVIRPKPGRKALRWFPGGGGVAFAREVNHPGTRGQPFFFADFGARQTRLLATAREAVADVLGVA